MTLPKNTRASHGDHERPRQQLLAAIDIFETAIVYSRYARDKGAVTRRIVDIADLTEILTDINRSECRYEPVGREVVAVGFDERGRRRVLIVRSAKRAKIACELSGRKKTINVSVPNLLAELIANKSGRWQNLNRLYAFGGKVGSLKESTQLYAPPLPNCYGDGRVCMGSVRTEKLGRLEPGAFFEKAFIESTFTDHLLETQLANTKTYRNIWHALKSTGGRVPLRCLKKVSRYGRLLKN